MTSSSGEANVLILGIGNVLMGDEGVGIHVVRSLENALLPEGVVRLDGGTGGFHLLEHLQKAKRVIFIDAASDGVPGTVRRLTPRFSSDYPSALTAHDIGLKDLLDALYLLGEPPEVTLFAVSINSPCEVSTRLSPEIEALAPRVAQLVMEEVAAAERKARCTSLQ